MTAPSSYQQRAYALLDRAALVAASRVADEWRAAEPDNALAWVYYGRVLRLRGRLVEARQAVEQALTMVPGHGEALVEAVRVHKAADDVREAQVWYGRTFEAVSEVPEWIGEWGDVRMRQGERQRACSIAAHLCALEPERASNWFQLGLALQAERAHTRALKAYERAALLDPRFPMLRNNMAAAHMELGDLERAEALLECVVAEEPDSAMLWVNLANVYLKRRDPHAALIAAERACAISPNYPVAVQAYSNVAKELQQWDAAQAAIEHAVQGAPRDLSLVQSLAVLQLVRGDYRNGFINHEARWSGSLELYDPRSAAPKPQWQRERLTGRTLLLWGEQGVGDVLQFVRFVPLIAARVRREGGRLVYCCFPELLELVERSVQGHVEAVVPLDSRSLPKFDFHLPLCSAPLVLGSSLEDLPASVPYLQTDTQKAAYWRERLPSSNALKVGLAWDVGRDRRGIPWRAVDPVELAKALRRVPGIEFYNLQFDAPADVTAIRECGLQLIDHTANFHSFDDTAAFIQNLDVVVTVCTSIAHLSGALAVPTWLMLDVNPHWVWMLDREDSPWYPSVRIFRQEQYGDWRSVLRHVHDELCRLATDGTGRPVLQAGRTES
jgi:tetratricopeptide (TPR) repeat protein